MAWLVELIVCTRTTAVACRAISSTTTSYTLNIKEGFCSCHDWGLHHLCAHLLACQQHPGLVQQCTFELAAPDDAAARISISRPGPLPLPDDVPDPLQAAGDVEALVGRLQAAAASKGRPAQQQQVSDT